LRGNADLSSGFEESKGGKTTAEITYLESLKKKREEVDKRYVKLQDEKLNSYLEEQFEKIGAYLENERDKSLSTLRLNQ
jgi:hypothetical protein